MKLTKYQKLAMYAELYNRKYYCLLSDHGFVLGFISPNSMIDKIVEIINSVILDVVSLKETTSLHNILISGMESPMCHYDPFLPIPLMPMPRFIPDKISSVKSTKLIMRNEKWNYSELVDLKEILRCKPDNTQVGRGLIQPIMTFGSPDGRLFTLDDLKGCDN